MNKIENVSNYRLFENQCIYQTEISGDKNESLIERFYEMLERFRVLVLLRDKFRLTFTSPKRHFIISDFMGNAFGMVSEGEINLSVVEDKLEVISKVSYKKVLLWGYVWLLLAIPIAILSAGLSIRALSIYVGFSLVIALCVFLSFLINRYRINTYIKRVIIDFEKS